MKKLYGVQYLRALAAIGVVIFHAADKTGRHFTIGAAGVDVFFVISGFIMWFMAATRPVSPGSFILDRVLRIGPVYWIATSVMVVGGLAGLFPNLVLTLDHVVASLLFIPARSPSSGEIWPLLVQGWTLNYEMFFYCIFAATLAFPSRYRIAAMAVLFTGLCLAGLAYDGESALALTYTNPRLLEFLVGTIIGKFWLDGSMPGRGLAGAAVVSALVGFAVIELRGTGYTVSLIGPLACLLVLGTVAYENAVAVPKLSLPAYVGDASYSIYLWHTFVISVVVKATGMLALPPAVTIPVASIGGVAGGLVAYELIERPLVRALRRQRTDRRQRVAA